MSPDMLMPIMLSKTLDGFTCKGFSPSVDQI